MFVDTNILVFANIPVSPRHRMALEAIERRRAAGETLWISRQVVREYLAVMSRPGPLRTPYPMVLLTQTVERFHEIFQIAEDGPAVTGQILALLARISCGGKQIHDANIVATMLIHGVGQLLTDNVADFARFCGVIDIISLDQF